METKKILSNLNSVAEFKQQSEKFKQAYLSRLTSIQVVIVGDIEEWLNRNIADPLYNLDFMLSDLSLNLELWHLPHSVGCADNGEITNWMMQEVWSWDNDEDRGFLASKHLSDSINSFIKSRQLEFDANDKEIDLWLNDSVIMLKKLLRIFSTTENICKIKSAHIAINIILTRMLVEVYIIRQFRSF